MITSRDNEKLKLVRKLADRRWRDKLGLFVAEGEDLVDAARAEGIEPVELLVAGETVDSELLAEVSSLPHPPRVLGIYRRGDLPRAALPELGVALWHVADPGNVGTLVRAADAFGAFVALSPGSADPTAPKALRASAGSIFRVPLVGYDEAPGRRIALMAHEGRSLEEILPTGPTLLVVGAEREGLPEEVATACDEQATILLTGPAESLNVAMAATVALYTFRRALTRYV